MRYLYIFATLFFTVYGQLILKWRLGKLSFSLPEGGMGEKLWSLLKIIFDPFIFSGFVSAFIASLFWMAAMTKFQITEAYPFMADSPKSSRAANSIFVIISCLSCLSGFRLRCFLLSLPSPRSRRCPIRGSA